MPDKATSIAADPRLACPFGTEEYIATLFDSLELSHLYGEWSALFSRNQQEGVS